MSSIIFGKTDQSPARVIAAVRGPRFKLEAAITICDGDKLKPEAIKAVAVTWKKQFAVEFPEDLEANISVAGFFETGRDRVSMHMCSQGMTGCHVVMLNGTRRSNCAEHIHSSDLNKVRARVESWATGLTRLEKFWFVASALSRYEELCRDPELDWWRQGSYRDPIVI